MAEFCPNKTSKEFREMSDIFGEEKAYFLWMRNKGNPLDKAPNGAESRLFQSLLKYHNGNRTEAFKSKAKTYRTEFFAWFGDWTGNYENTLDTEGVTKEVQKNGKIRLSLPSHTEEHPRQIVIDPQGLNTYYVHMRIWDGEKVPADISAEDKIKLFNALYKELPAGAEILFPKSGEGYYGTRGTVAGLLRLSRDPRFEKGSEGILLYEDKDKDGNTSIKTYTGTSFIKRNLNSVSKIVDENGEPTVMYHGTPWGEFDTFRHFQPNTGDRTKPGEFYFTPAEFWASTYTLGTYNKGDKSPKIYAVYINLKYPYHPGKNILTRAEANATLFELYASVLTEEEYDDIYKILDESGALIEQLSPSQWNPTLHDYDIYNVIANYFKRKDQEERFVQVIKALRQKEISDGMLWMTREENQGSPIVFNGLKRLIVVFDPNQIKSINNKGTFSMENDNIYRNRGENTSAFEEESSKYYFWLGQAKKRLEQASPAEQESVKDLLVLEFNSLGFKHFEVHPMYSKPSNSWYLATRNDMDRKDLQDLRELAKKIGYTKLGVHTFTDKQLETLLRYLFSQVNGENEHMRNIMNVLWYALKNRTIKIEFVTENSYKDSPAYYNHETGTIVVNTNGAFVNSNGYSNIAAQTLLHELLHAVTIDTIKHSPELRNQLQSLFNKVKQSARIKYNGQENAYGLTDMYEFLAELSNEGFVKTLLNIHTGSDKSFLQSVYEFIKTVAAKVLSSVFKKYKGTAYADAMEIFVKAALPAGFKLDLQNEPLDEQTIFNVVSARQQAAEKEAQRIAVRMNVLYREYEKIKSKTPSQERLANQIFEVNNELKQHMNISAIGIALEQAKLTLGQYDPITNGPAVMLHSNIYKYLYDKSQQGFVGMTPDQLVDMYRNSIKFYQDLINGIPSDRVIDLSDADKRNIELILSLIKNYIMPLWTEAIIKVGDDIVDAQVDQEVTASDQDKADMKEVAKDWLHKNIMYGDLNVVTNYVYNYSYSSNPIIKQAFHLIQHAEQMTLEEMHHIAPKLMRAYQAANKGTRSITPGWQSVMMEFDDEGKPTGNFLRDINYGQYLKDLKNFRETLNSDFLDDYGFTYVIDDTGAIVNSLTGEYAEDEEWGPNGEMPKYVEYLRAIEIFKGPRVFRRFTPDYYLERLTRPYDGTIDPMSPEFKDTRFNHGLSPKTLKRYSYYQTNINYYLNKCQDSKTGLIYPERLSSDDRLALENWNTAFDKFKDIFNEDGSYKSGEELKMAYEVRAWQKWIGERSNSTRFQDSFNAEKTRIYQECLLTGDMRPYNTFMKHNASAGINPDYIELTVGSFMSYHKETDSSYRARILRKALLDAVKSPLTYSRTLMDMKNRPLFWLHCKASDQAIDDARDPDDRGNSGWTPQQVEEYKKKFYNREILYTDERGYFIDENGNQVQPNSQQAKVLEEEGKLLTMRQYLINYYTDEALRNGHVEGLIDESNGNYIDFSGMTATDIKHQITNLMSYRRRNFEEDGSITEEYVPLTIFSMLWPTKDEFFNKRTGKKEKTVVYLGEGRFKESYSLFTTSATDFNPNEGIAEKPNTSFDGGRYDNSLKYNEMRKDNAVAQLYDDLIETMQNMLSIYSTNRKFNYRLPQINARTAALFSRIIKRGYSEKSLSAIWNSMTNIEANDDDMRTKEDYFVGVDGEVANTVPLKFIRNLKNPEDISTDLVSSVIMFADMALNYKNKSAIDATLKVLRYNMDEATRTTDKNRYGLFGGKLESNEYSKQMFDSMLNSHMYGNQWTGKNKQGGPSRTKIATFKTVEAFQSFESGAMLGLNFFSMSVGFADSMTRIFAESAAGKYMTPGDCLFALGVCLWNTPKCIKNMFNPLANNKMTALMQMNGISKGTYGIYTKADWGKGRKFFTNILMGGWSMLDWMANALLMTAFYHNCRFYEGGEIPTGFYTKYEMLKAFAKIGKSKSYANNVHHNWSNYGRRVTLWDAYYYNGKGEVFVKPEYESYVTLRIKTQIATKTKKRGGLYNGMNPDNDVPQWKRDVIGRLVGALRAWIPQLIQHLFAGGTDNIARKFEDVNVFETTSSGTRMKTKSKKVKLTDEERSRRFAWDYETGTTQDQIIVGLWRSINTIYKKINQWALHKPKTAKLSEVEKYAMKDAIIFMAMLSLMMVGWTYTHDWAREVPKPKDRYEAGPMSWWNPVDYYNYMRDVYIPNEYWRLAVDDVYFRTIEAKISNISPFQVLDIVNAATALKSGADDQFNLLGLGWDLINGSEDIDVIQKQGAYKFYTQGERNFYRGIGFLKNTHTFLTYEGATNNLRWYTNRFGRVFRMVGYDFKSKPKENTNDNSGRGSGGNKVGGNRSGGNRVGGGRN